MTNYSRLRNEGRLTGTIKAAQAKRKARDNSQEMPRRATGMAATTLIDLGPAAAAAATSAGRTAHPRRRNWNSPAACRTSKRPTVAAIDEGRYSSRCTYKKYSYTPHLRSCGKCTAGLLVAFIGPDRIRIPAPRGWEFGNDVYGMFIARTSNSHRESYRYHFDSDDVKNGRTLVRAACRHEQEQKHVRRSRIARDKAATAANLANKRTQAARESLLTSGRVWVTFADARRAGSCAAGIRTFCSQHELNPSTAYPLKAVQQLAGIDGRVNLAINAALDRAAADDLRGFCKIG
jgi:hypothetical protein